MRAAIALAVAACAALGSGAAPAAAQIRSIEEQRGGAWLYRAGHARERTACILETDSPAGVAAGGHVRFALLNRPFEFQMSVRDLRWRIPPGATGTVRIAVEGGGVPSGAYASAQRAQQAGPAGWWSISRPIRTARRGSWTRCARGGASGSPCRTGRW
jgi:hypothetical protein